MYKKIGVVMTSIFVFSVISSNSFAYALDHEKKGFDDILIEKVKIKYQMSDQVINDLTVEQLQSKIAEIDDVSVSKKEQYFKTTYLGTNTNTMKALKIEEVPKSAALLEVNELKKSNFLSISNKAIATNSCGNYSGYDCVNEGWVKLETWITKKNDKSSGKVSARFEWLSDAFYRDKDVLAIGLNSHFSPVPGTESATYKYESQYRYGPLNTETVNLTDVTRDAGGYGYKVDLKNDQILDYIYIYNHRVYMEYQYKPQVTNAVLVDAYSKYAHQEKNFAIEPSFGIPLGGSLALQQEDEFNIVTGHAQLTW